MVGKGNESGIIGSFYNLQFFVPTICVVYVRKKRKTNTMPSCVINVNFCFTLMVWSFRFNNILLKKQQLASPMFVQTVDSPKNSHGSPNLNSILSCASSYSILSNCGDDDNDLPNIQFFASMPTRNKTNINKTLPTFSNKAKKLRC